MKTVRVKIAVAIDPTGNWNSSGWSNNGVPVIKDAMDIAVDGVGDGEQRYWIEADIPVPEQFVIEGIVVKDET